MSISRTKPGSWAVNDVLTSAEMNSLDTALTTALDKTVAGDTLSGAITLSGAGRVIPSVTLGSDANSTITVGGGNTVLRVTSAVTANRDYTLSATGAATNDVITIYAESSFAYSITVKDQASATMFTLGNTDSDDGPWCSFIYVGGWRLFQTSGGSRQRQVTYTSGSGNFTVPAGVTSLLLIGWGGGGGGGGGRTGTTTTTDVPGGGGGGAGAIAVTKRVAVTPGDVIAYAIGGGGSYGSGGGVPTEGGNGGSTTFGSTTFLGGNGGHVKTSVIDVDLTAKGGETGTTTTLTLTSLSSHAMSTAQAGGNGGLAGLNYPQSPQAGGRSGEYAGGAAGTNGAVSGGYWGGGGGGGGGAGPGGVGGDGGDGGSGAGGATAGQAAAANTGAGGGGGGAGGNVFAAPISGMNGGDGGSGQLTIIWVK